MIMTEAREAQASFTPNFSDLELLVQSIHSLLYYSSLFLHSTTASMAQPSGSRMEIPRTSSLPPPFDTDYVDER